MKMWKRSELDYIEENYDKMSDQEIASTLNRSARSVSRKRRSLSIMRTEVGEWTERDTKYLTENYLSLSDEEIGNYIGKPKSSVLAKRSRMKLRKMDSWTDEEDNHLFKLFRTKTYKEIGDILNKTESSVTHRVRHLELNESLDLWTEKEEKFIRDNFRHMSNKEIADSLNRTSSSVSNKKQIMGCSSYKLRGITKLDGYINWKSMMSRCYNMKKDTYSLYGGRGITVCEEWHDAVSFCSWASNNGWEKGLTVDRIDNDGNYCPENCRWATQKEQHRNKRNNRILSAFGESKTLIEWAEDDRCVVSYSCFSSRIYREWDVERSLCTPSSRRK